MYGPTKEGFRKPALFELDELVKNEYAAAMRRLLGKGQDWEPIWTDAQTSTAFYRVLIRELGRLWDALEHLYFCISPHTASGDALDLLVGEHGMVRQAAVKARHLVTFTAAGATTGVRIPKGTRVATEDGIQFETIEDEILSGRSVDAIVECLQYGPKGNVGGGAITRVISSLPASVRVTNTAHVARLATTVQPNIAWEVPPDSGYGYFQVVRVADIGHPRFLDAASFYLRNPVTNSQHIVLSLVVADHLSGRVLYPYPILEITFDPEEEKLVTFDGMALDLFRTERPEYIRLVLVNHSESDGPIEVLGNTTIPYVYGRWHNDYIEESTGCAIFQVVSMRPGTPIVYGRDAETDAELRLRYLLEKARGGSSHPEAIISRIWNVPRVEAVHLRYNRRDYDWDGMTPHSIELTVDGGDPLEVARTLFRAAPCGIELVGNVAVSVEDIHGQYHEVRFNRPQRVPVYVSVELLVTPAFSAADVDTVKDAIIEAIGGMDTKGRLYRGAGIGGTVRVAQIVDNIMDIPGVYDVVDLKIGKTQPPSGSQNVEFNPAERPWADETTVTVTIALR